jgi:hypothetical protein
MFHVKHPKKQLAKSQIPITKPEKEKSIVWNLMLGYRHFYLVIGAWLLVIDFLDVSRETLSLPQAESGEDL